jgi:hypothetical protein
VIFDLSLLMATRSPRMPAEEPAASSKGTHKGHVKKSQPAQLQTPLHTTVSNAYGTTISWTPLCDARKWGLLGVKKGPQCEGKSKEAGQLLLGKAWITQAAEGTKSHQSCR